MARTRKNGRKKKQHYKQNVSLSEVRKKMESFKKSESLVFERILQKETIQQIVETLGCETRDRIYTTHVTLLAFLGQAVSDDGSCQQAVHRINRQRCSTRLPPASVDTNSYCKARRRLPEELFRRLLDKSAEMIQRNEPEQWLWNKRRVVLVDGLTTRAPDTPANQAEFPQPSSQKPGLGFPQVRHLAAFSLSCAAVLDVQIGPLDGKKNGEISLFRKMMPVFRSGDVVLADANFDSYVDIADLKARGVDFVGAMGGSRTSPFTGKCRCVEEKQVELARPKFNKNRFTREQWEALPESLPVRIIRYRTTGRNEEITIITTLLDRKRYSARSIAELYGFRWNCELDIRTIKTLMGMEALRCKSPEMLRREIFNYYLAYNMVRAAMCDAARLSGRTPRRLSFKNTMQTFVEFGVLNSHGAAPSAVVYWSIAGNEVGNRPGRKEPRKVKLRKSKYPYMTKSRKIEQEMLYP